MKNGYYGARSYRSRIKYKNLALILAVILLITVLICASCGHKDNSGIKDTDPINDPSIPTPVEPPENDTQDPDKPLDPADQKSYLFDYVTKNNTDLGVGTLVLVNNNIKFMGQVNEDELLVIRTNKNSAYWVKDYTVTVLPETMSALNNMLLDFSIATNNTSVMVRSGYRSLETQQQLYDDELKQTGADSSTLVAMPGYSEHHTGLVVDFTTYENKVYKDFDGTGDYKWIMDNCDKYGFVNRYPKGKEKLTLIDNEPWHFRYVGVPHASIMKDYDLCLEEYISFIKNYTIDTGFLLKETENGAKYIVYYIPASNTDETNIYYPLKPDGVTPYPYEISGNNVDGFIVTVTLEEGRVVNNNLNVPQTPDDSNAENTNVPEE